jgi:hypothetical protein
MTAEQQLTPQCRSPTKLQSCTITDMTLRKFLWNKSTGASSRSIAIRQISVHATASNSILHRDHYIELKADAW